MQPIDDQIDNFIVDDEGNAIAYDDDDEEELEEKEKPTLQGPLRELVKNMALANQANKSRPKGLDQKMIENKKGAISSLLNQLDDDDDDNDRKNKLKTLNTKDEDEDIEMEGVDEYISNHKIASNMLNVSESYIDEVPGNFSFEMPKREKKEVQLNRLISVGESPIKRTREEVISNQNSNPMLMNRTPVSSNRKLKEATTPQSMLGRTLTKIDNTPIRSLESSVINEEHNMNSASSAMSSLSMRKSTSEQLPVKKDGSLYVYWYDAIEDNVRLKPCVIFFGKVYQPQTDSYSSISVIFNNINRTMYVLPKSPDPNSNEKDYEENIKEVYDEFEHLRKTKFNNIKSFLSKTVKRKYCFELPIDREKEHKVLKVKYNSEYGTLPSNITGETFSYIFGKNSSLLETILINKKIQGPCWLKIANFEYGSNYSNTWTVFEITVKDYKNIQVVNDPKFTTPPFKILSLSTKTLSSSNGNELFCISCAMKDNFYIEDEKGINKQEDFKKTIFMRKIDNKLPGMEKKGDFEVTYQQLKKLFGEGNLMMAQNEMALLNQFINKVFQYDPDVIVGHNLYSGHIDTLCSRINKIKPVNWSRIGRFKREVIPKFLQNVNLANIYIRNCLAGRLIVDTFLSARDVVRETNYDLNNICEKYLGYKIPEVNASQIIETFTSIKQIEQLLIVIYEEAQYSFLLMDHFSVLPLTKQLTAIAGNLWIKSLQFSRADRGEMLLLHEFHNKKYIIPDKLSKAAEKLNEEEDEDNDNPKNKNARKRKPAYSGGLVLEPQPGLYDEIVLLLDFNSLYPSIIQEFNICFTTVDRNPTQSFVVNNYLSSALDPKKKKGKGKNLSKEPSSKIEEEDNEHQQEFDEDKISIKQKEKAILPSIVEFVVKSRKKVKDELKKEKDPLKLSLLEIRQKALKLTANSLYGYLGYKNSRFYAKDIAQLITFKGRKILKNAADIVKIKHNLNVIYGDTDSVMINTLTRKVVEAVEIGNKIKKSINDQYHLLEMDIDGLFKSLLLLRKKKYVSLKYLPPYRDDSKSIREIKGLDLVRRDWCTLSKNIGLAVLDIILSGKGKDDIISDIIDKLQSITIDIDENKIPLKDYEITKQLTKNIDDYTDLKALPHVKVAKRLKENGDTSISIGFYVPYIVCLPLDNESNTKSSIADRSYHLKEIEANTTLKIDIKWYKENQIYSTVARLVKHIQEIDGNLLCKSLGLEAKHYVNQSSNQNQVEFNESPNSLSLKTVVKHGVSVPCLKCKEVNQVNVFSNRCEVFQNLCTCDKCKSIDNQKAAHKLSNNLLLAMKEDVFLYYRRKKKCLKCKENTSRLFYMTECPEDSCKGMMKRETTEFETANELNFINKIIQPDKANQSNELQRSDILEINHDKQLQSYASRMMNNIAYNNINITQLFGFLNVKNK